jgi:hypothetical protein
LTNIDGILRFNTKDNIFGNIEQKVADRRRGPRKRQNDTRQTENPIGIDLANTKKLDNTMGNSLVPNINAEEIQFKPEKREAAKIEIDGGLGLQGVVDFGFAGDNDFMGGDMGFGAFEFTGFDDDPFSRKPKATEESKPA